MPSEIFLIRENSKYLFYTSIFCLAEFSKFQFIIMSDRFETLEEHLERFIENTRQLGIIVSDFQPQGQNALNQKL